MAKTFVTMLRVPTADDGVNLVFIALYRIVNRDEFRTHDLAQGFVFFR